VRVILFTLTLPLALGTFGIITAGSLMALSSSGADGLDPFRYAEDADFIIVVAGSSLVPIVILVWLFSRYLDRKPMADYGLRTEGKWLLQILGGGVAGCAAVAVLFVLFFLLGWLKIESVKWMNKPSIVLGTLTLFGYALAFLCQSAGEEIIFRGYYLQNLIECWRPLAATAATAVGFSLLHCANPGFSQMAALNIFLIGIWFAMAYFLTASLWVPIGFHWGWNTSLSVIFGLPVSGMDFPALLQVRISGEAALWTGGSFGPEGGLAVTLLTTALLLGTARMMFVRRRTAAPLSNEAAKL